MKYRRLIVSGDYYGYEYYMNNVNVISGDTKI